MGRPRSGETPIRHVRVSDKLWGKVSEVARQQERTASAVVNDALEEYVDRELNDDKSEGG
jgi:predicted transcriptional regulator